MKVNISNKNGKQRSLDIPAEEKCQQAVRKGLNHLYEENEWIIDLDTVNQDKLISILKNRANVLFT